MSYEENQYHLGLHEGLHDASIKIDRGYSCPNKEEADPWFLGYLKGLKIGNHIHDMRVDDQSRKAIWKQCLDGNPHTLFAVTASLKRQS